MTTDIKIDQLQLILEGSVQYERRAQPLITRAVSLVAERLAQRGTAQSDQSPTRRLERLRVPPLKLDLQLMGDEQAASAIADAIVDQLMLKLQG